MYWNYNVNFSCNSLVSLMKTEVVLKCGSRNWIIEREVGLMKTEVVLKFLISSVMVHQILSLMKTEVVLKLKVFSFINISDYV